jgi:hypothetical protein
MAAASGKQDPQDRFAGAMESLMVLSESMQQASSLLADEDPAEEAPNQATYSFLNVVALGNVVCSPLPFIIIFSLFFLMDGCSLFSESNLVAWQTK